MHIARRFRGMVAVGLLLTIASTATAKYSGGTGEPNDPYQIATAGDLIALGETPADYDKHFILTADIDLDPNLPARKIFDKAVIASDINDATPGFEGTPFTGVFDGCGRTISHLTIKGKDCVGLFGCLVWPAEVRNLGVVEADITGSKGVGGLVGYNGEEEGWRRNSGGVVTQCYSTGTVGGSFWVGGLVGSNDYGEVTGCYSTGTVGGSFGIGGLVGGNDYGEVTGCYSTGTVSGKSRVGGLMGSNFYEEDWASVAQCYSTAAVSGTESVGGLLGRNDGCVMDCYSTGIVSGTSYIGGLVGYHDYGSITKCYSSGAVSGSLSVGGLVGRDYCGTLGQCYSVGGVSGMENVGGLVGSNYQGQVIASFWDTQTSGQTGSAGGIGKTTAEMQSAPTFLDAGWDFVGETANGTEDIWRIAEGLGYPHLSWEKYSGGTGEPNDPYQIATAADLIALGETPVDYDKHFVLTADIDLDPKLPGRKVFDKAVIAPITINDWGRGRDATGTPFTGVFDGHGHTISHLTIKGKDYVGLFGCLLWPAEVRNLGVVDVDITGSAGVGGLVGYNGVYSGEGYAGGGVVTQCHSSGVVSGHSYVGGVVGRNFNDEVDSVTVSYSSAAVNGTDSVGGLVGSNEGRVIHCYSTGVVSGKNQVGGLVGHNYYGFVSQCFSSGPVSGTGDCVGGLVGYNSGGNVVQCYSTGAVSGTEYIGGLVGSNNQGRVVACFWDIQTSGQATSAGGTGKTTAQMRDPNTFVAAGWDLVGQPDGPHDIWGRPEGGGYPIFWWQLPVGYGLPAFSGGGGEANDPYLISTPEELNRIGHNPRLMNSHFKLTGDIDLAGVDFCTIGDYDYGWYNGVFDGNGKTVKNLRNHLFDCADGLIKDLRLLDPNCIYSPIEENYGTITSCSVQGGNTGGGLVGNNWGTVIQCYSMAVVVSADRGAVGGLVRYNGGTVTQCYSTGAVSGGQVSVGGLVGYNSGTVSHCYSTGPVSGKSAVGGLVGTNGSSWEPGYVACCYSTGPVIGTGYDVGGLVGANRGSATVSQCLWDIQTSGQSTSSGGTGKTTAEMQTAKTFLDAGWDFVGEAANGTEDIWWIDEGKDYPRLSWQGPAGMVFVDIPAGMFLMGDHDGVGGDDERPVHTVTLDGFQMSKYETTNAQYAQYLNATMAGGLIQVVNGVVYASSDSNQAEPYCDTYSASSYSQIEYSQGRFTVRSRDGKAMSDHPVVSVSWYGAKAFCDYYEYRLPTEAEWEYAARGGYHDPYYRYPWGGNTIDCSKANYWDDSGFRNPCNPLNLGSEPYTSAVGYYGPQGAYGLCDMSGNVWEWCQDWWGYYSAGSESNPTGPAAGGSRVLRGGSWGNDDDYCRVAYRYGSSLGIRFHLNGFRVCR